MCAKCVGIELFKRDCPTKCVDYELYEGNKLQNILTMSCIIHVFSFYRKTFLFTQRTDMFLSASNLGNFLFICF